MEARVTYRRLDGEEWTIDYFPESQDGDPRLYQVDRIVQRMLAIAGWHVQQIE